MPIERRRVILDDLELSYLEAGEGAPVLLLHGWPTSALLWRNVMPPIAEERRVIALDLPGFGHSDKPSDPPYTFDYFADVLDRFVDALGIERPALAVYDLGGPVGLYWASRGRPLDRLAILNTLIYPDLGLAVRTFLLAMRLPLLRDAFTTQWGLAQTLRFGMASPRRLSPADRQAAIAPYQSSEARAALIATLRHADRPSFEQIAAWLPTLDVPVRVVVGERDRVLPDVLHTVARLHRDVPHAEVTTLPDCGHFLQEDRPDEVGEILAAFFAPSQ